MRRGHPRAAVNGHRHVGSDAQIFEPAPELGCRQETPGSIHVLRCRRTEGAGDMPGTRINGFKLAPVPLAGPGVQQDPRPCPMRCGWPYLWPA